jgi:hypothetical protein
MEINKEYLIEKYIKQNLTINKLSEETGLTKHQIKGKLRRLGIRKRKLSLGKKIYDDYYWLYDQYMIQKKGYTVIANELGISYTTILDRIRYFGWPLRGHHDIDKGAAKRGKKLSPESIEKIKSTRVKKRILTQCMYCNKTFELRKSSYNKYENHYCNQDCFKKYLKDNRVETENITDSAEYKEWRLKVYRRDHYCCQMPGCSSKTKKIHAHHVFPRKDYPEKMFDVSNGITLCRKCHEMTYGKEMQFTDAFDRIVRNDK